VFFSLLSYSLLILILFEYCFGAEGYIVITSKYVYCHTTSQPPADVSLPFPEYRCGEVDSCACLLSRQENHRAEVKKHVLPNVSPFETACPESRLKRFSRRRSPTGRNLKNAWKPSESAGKEVVGRRTRGHKRMGDSQSKGDMYMTHKPRTWPLENAILWSLSVC